ncbi:MAG: permease [Candidatus Omnitrophica bacterium]|nr:permease [Candidatus Omnitrophota bacterium]
MAVKILAVIEHTSREFYDVGRFLILGALLSSFMQVFIPRARLISIGQGEFSSVAVMMLLAFVLSLCSEADAFIARTFLGQFTVSSIVAFLVYGPMIDIKNLLMLSGAFRPKFIFKLVSLITLTGFAAAISVHIWLGVFKG